MRDILAGEEDRFLNVHGQSRDARARILSALSNRPFELDGQMFASLEGFYQGIKFPIEDCRRVRAFASSFGYAKAFSIQAKREFVWWKSEQMPYASDRHKELIKRAFQASFDQNPDRMEALIATKDLIIFHETGEEDALDAPITRKEFCEILTEIREKTLK